MSSEPIDWGSKFRFAPDVNLHIVGRDGLVLCEGSQELYGLNTTATFVWCCLEEDLTPQAVSSKLESTFGISRDSAKAYIGQCLSEWSRQGLTVGKGDRPATGRGKAHSPAPAPPPQTSVRFGLGETETYKLLDSTFAVDFSRAETKSLISNCLGHLTVAGRGEVRLAIHQDDDGSYELRDGAGRYYRVPGEGLVPAVKSYLADAALGRGSYFLAIHAAALRFGRSSFLLAGAAGSGKSTLAAVLLGMGCDLYSDDIAVLSEDDLTLRPFPLSVGAKPGSWDIIGRYHAEISELPIHVRTDGKRVRYWTPAKERIVTAQERNPAPQAIFFVAHCAQAALCLEPFDKANAMARLLQGESYWPGRITKRHVARMIDWLKRLDCLSLTFADAEAAASKILEHLEQQRKSRS